jgi:release factor glutamine methyltransferase
MTSYEEALNIAIRKLEEKDIENPKLDAWYLLAHLSGMSRVDFLLRKYETMPELQEMMYLLFLDRRMKHEPLQYIIGEQEFMGINFVVDQNVLIPRQDTEILVELALSESKEKRILDVCTGSGCIAVSIAKLGSPKSVTALDISAAALKIARENATKNQVEIDFVESNMFEKITQTYDIIVSNPPYIRSEEISTLMPEVRQFEPILALDGEEDGLEFYRILAEEAKNHLSNLGSVIFEIGCDQADAVVKLLSENGYYNIKVTKDYANLDRVVSANYEAIG